MVDTRKAPRRELSFHCTGCLKEDLARIESSHRRGTLVTTGNWSAGEILDHVAKSWEFALDGFPPEARVALPMRLIARLMKRRFTSGRTLPAGFQAGRHAQYMMPVPGTEFDAGMARLRRVLDRLDAGEEMQRESPAFGRLTHEEWMRLHLAHAQLHLGFIDPK